MMMRTCNRLIASRRQSQKHRMKVKMSSLLNESRNMKVLPPDEPFSSG